jgi:cAMP-dependent protein kinase regulator
LLKEYQPGEAFGELALLYNAPRAATLISKTSCILWILDRECFNHIVKDSAQKKREKYENFLKSVEILNEVDSFEIGQIADALRSSNYSKGEYIIKEGELGDVFYIVEEGTAAATKTFEPGKNK